MRSIAVVSHSNKGHSQAQANAVAYGASLVEGIVVNQINVEDINSHWETLNQSNAIIFGCPTYMGTVSGQFKCFMDSTLDIWSTQKWRNKFAAGFTISAAPSGDKLNTLIQLLLFAAQHGMLWISLDLLPGRVLTEDGASSLNRLGGWIGAMAQSQRDQTLPLNQSDWETAVYLGRRVALISQNLVSEQMILKGGTES